ncbi:MAG: glycosyl hydrolase [Phycisphaerales bacterium]|nr:carbohydrate-binding protein [Planctomycetota bacterium]
MTMLQINRPIFALASCLSALAAAQPVVPAGSGSYYNGVPSGYAVPTNADGAPCLPRTATGFSGPVPTNEWWSSLVYPRAAGDNWGQNMHPHPLSARPTADGMNIGYAPTPVIAGTYYNYDFGGNRIAMALSVEGLNAPDCRLAAAGDWTVTARFADASRSIDVTLGHGMPFAYCKVTGGNAKVVFRSSATVFANRGNIIGVTIGGVPYALCAPAGASWTINSSSAISNLAGKDYYSVALLPDTSSAALDLVQKHAFVYVTGSTVAWNYNSAASTMDATFTFQTSIKEGSETAPLIALYRHQYLNSTQPTTGGTFLTSRGTMKQAETASFTVNLPYRGILPRLPGAEGLNQSQLYSLVNQAYQAASLNSAGDTYGSGKSYGRVAQLLYLADQVGHTQAKARFLSFLKSELADWFTAGTIANGGPGGAFSTIEAETYSDGSGVSIGNIDGGQAVVDFSGTDWFKLSSVDFSGGTPNGMSMRFASGTSGSGLFQVRVDSINGPLLAEAGIGNTGGANTWVNLNLGVNSAGVNALATNNRVHDLYITCNTPYSGELMRIDWIKFNLPGAGGSSTDTRNFYYQSAWSTLLGNPGSFNLAQEMNDHNFHYGYFVMAAAAVAQFDPAWASAYGPMVELLIRDASNWERSDTRFPFLRSFDPYAGHSWASGHAAFAAGNNQESSSESMNFSAAAALWGAATGNSAIRDMGMFLCASEEAAIQQYWFNADDAVMPAAFTKPIAGIVWGDGVAYGTWWTGDPAQIHGINFLPVTAASLYLGHNRQGMLDNWSLLMAQTGNNPSSWHSILYSALATANPTQAASLLSGNPGYDVEAGDSAARTYQWIQSLNIWGPVNAAISADTPHYAVFEKSGIRRYIAWNPGTTTLGVHFSDGFLLCVPPGSIATGKTGDAPGLCACPADFDQDGQVDDADFVFFANSYNLLDCADASMPAGCPADFNDDHFVDDADFVLFAQAYDRLLCA